MKKTIDTFRGYSLINNAGELEVWRKGNYAFGIKDADNVVELFRNWVNYKLA